MTRQLRMILEGTSSVPSTHILGHMATCNAISKESKTLFWVPQVPRTWHTFTHTHKQNNTFWRKSRNRKPVEEWFKPSSNRDLWLTVNRALAVIWADIPFDVLLYDKHLCLDLIPQFWQRDTFKNRQSSWIESSAKKMCKGPLSRWKDANQNQNEM